MESKSVTLNGDIPQFLKIMMVFIDRVGFPILAFILMFFLSYSSLGKMTEAIEKNSIALSHLEVSNTSFQEVVKSDHLVMKNDINEIKKYSYGYQDHVSGKAN